MLPDSWIAAPSTWLFIAAALFGLFAIVMFYALRRAIRARRPVASVLRLLWVVVLDVLVLACVLLAFALTGYARLTSEVPVLDLAFQQTGAQRYEVEVLHPDGRRERFDLHGDDWRVDVKVVKWRPWAVLAGLDPVYRLDRIGGRYRTVADERERERSVHTLAISGNGDLWDLAQRHPRWLPFVDTEYGSSAYLPMRDGGRARVTLSPLGGLVARPLAAGDGAIHE